MDSDMEWGEIAYEAYRARSCGRSLVSGAEIPAWADLNPEIKAAWTASAAAVRRRCAGILEGRSLIPTEGW